MTVLPTADRLLDEAHRLLMDGGYKAFSYADLSERVGIRKASIHHHFPTKAGLVLALLARYRQRHRELTAIQLPTLPDLSSRLRAFASYWQHCIESNHEPICLAVMLATELPALPPEIALKVTMHFTELAFLLEGEFALGGVQEPRKEAELFIAMLHGAMISARAIGDPSLFSTIMGQWLERVAA